MDKLERRFKFSHGGTLKNPLGVYCKWVVIDNGKAFYAATMAKRVKSNHLLKEKLRCTTLRERHMIMFRKNEDKPIDR